MHGLRETSPAATVDVTYECRDRGPAYAPSRWLLYRDGVLLVDVPTPGRVLDELLVDLDDLVMERVQGSSLAVHAAAVELQGRVVLLPAASGSGKTTLAAAAVVAGARYVTDEAAVIDQETFAVTPYARPLCIKSGSQSLIQELVRGGTGPVGDAPSWHVAPDLLGAVSSGGQLRAVVVPQYQDGAATSLTEITRAEAMLAVAGQSSFLARRGPEVLSQLRALVSQGPCARLVFSDVRDAADRLLNVLR